MEAQNSDRLASQIPPERHLPGEDAIKKLERADGNLQPHSILGEFTFLMLSHSKTGATFNQDALLLSSAGPH